MPCSGQTSAGLIGAISMLIGTGFSECFQLILRDLRFDIMSSYRWQGYEPVLQREGIVSPGLSFVIGFWLCPAFLSLGLGVFLPHRVSVELLMYSYDKYIRLIPTLHFKTVLSPCRISGSYLHDASKKIHTFSLYSESAVTRSSDVQNHCPRLPSSQS